MSHWRRIKSAAEWGFFYGIISWLLATGISNKIPTWGVWAIILSRVLLGVLIGIIRWEYPWWARGMLMGSIVNLPLAFIIRTLGVGWVQGFWPMFISGIIVGLLIEVSLRYGSAKEKGDSREHKK